MNTPFDKCGTLNLAGIRSGRYDASKPNLSNTPSSLEPDFVRRQIMLIIDPKGNTHSFTLMGGEPWLPTDINNYLRDVLEMDIRVDTKGIAYIPEEPCDCAVGQSETLSSTRT